MQGITPTVSHLFSPPHTCCRFPHLEAKRFFKEKGGFFSQLSMIINRLFRSFAKKVPQLFFKKSATSREIFTEEEGGREKTGKGLRATFARWRK